MTTPLTLEEETAWRAVTDAATRSINIARADMDRVWATLDAEREARSKGDEGLREALNDLTHRWHRKAVDATGNDFLDGARSAFNEAIRDLRDALSSEQQP